MKMDCISEKWSTITGHLQTKYRAKGVWSILGRIMLGALVYMIWQERNNRIHLKKSTLSTKLSVEGFKLVRLKILALELKNTTNVAAKKTLWKID